MPNLRDRRGWMLRNRFSPESSTVSRTSKTGRHPALMGMKKVAVGGADVHLRRRKRAATQNFLINKPFVVVLVKLGFESGVRHVVRGRPVFLPREIPDACRSGDYRSQLSPIRLRSANACLPILRRPTLQRS